MERRPTSRRRRRRRDRSAAETYAGTKYAVSPPDPPDPDRPRVETLGPYETRYDVSRGYGLDRTIVRP